MYVADTRAAVRDTLDWLAGDAAVTPATGAELAADDEAIGLELMRAEDMERAALDERRSADAVRPGRVAATLAWFLCDEVAEPPL